MNKKQIICILLTILLLGSCTMTKRHYRKGFYVEWHHNMVSTGIGESHQPEEKNREESREFYAINERTINMVKDTLVTPSESSIKKSYQDQQNDGMRCSDEKMPALQNHTFPNAEVMNPKVLPLDDQSNNEVLAKDMAEDAFLFGILSLGVLIFIGFFASILTTIAFRKARKAKALNTANDPEIAKKIRLARIFSFITIYVSIAMVLTILLLAIFLF